MENPERDRYDQLLRHLQAGREIPLQPRGRRFGALDIHPSARRIVLIAVLVAVAWFVAIAATDAIRQGRVDTWTGPATSVQSGLELAGCTNEKFREDVYFPAWLRFEGKVYLWSDQVAPIASTSVGRSYLETGYRLGELELYRIASSPDGQAGRHVLVRQGDSPAGAIYVQSDCR
jgi:hypothetical protein